jgi:hypothetical protein
VRIAEAIPSGWPGLFVPDYPRIGLGLDIGTTDKQSSNPSALAVIQQVAHTYYVRLLVAWKSRDDRIVKALVDHVLTGLPHGYRARRLCIDASSERYFAANLKRALMNRLPCQLVINSESTEYLGEQMNYKAYLGNLLIGMLSDGYLALPNETFVRTDFRLVKTNHGVFDAEVNEDGQHADCFDAVKLALHALVSKGGPVEASASQVGNYTTAGAGRDRFPMRPEDLAQSDHPGALSMP